MHCQCCSNGHLILQNGDDQAFVGIPFKDSRDYFGNALSFNLFQLELPWGPNVLGFRVIVFLKDGEQAWLRKPQIPNLHTSTLNLKSKDPRSGMQLDQRVPLISKNLERLLASCQV